jgi:hypothetical protein
MRNNQLREKIQRGPVASTSPLKGIIMAAHYGSFEPSLLLLKLKKKTTQHMNLRYQTWW